MRENESYHLHNTANPRIIPASLVAVMSRSPSWWLPPGASRDAGLILTARGVRAFTDGYVALLLPYYLTLLGYNALEVGIIATATLLGTGILTLLTGVFAYRFRMHALLTAACLLMLGTGVGFATVTDFLPLLLIAVIGTLNPSNGDVSIFLPLEQSLLSHSVTLLMKPLSSRWFKR